MEKTNISWCDSTWNPWEGCTKVSAGCAHCYAEARDKRFTGGKLWGKGATRRKSKSAIKMAFKLNREPMICDVCGVSMTQEMADGYTNQGHKHLYAGNCERGSCDGKFHRRRIFSLSLGDWLDDEVPIEWLAEMLDTIRQCEQVIWILCTKRPENWQQRLSNAALAIVQDEHGRAFSEWAYDWQNGKPPSNIILLASVENQEVAETRIPALLKIPAAYRGLSLEPLLAPVSVCKWLYHKETTEEFPKQAKQRLNWLIIGCESGHNRRDCDGNWIRDLTEQGKIAGISVFVKQILVEGKVSTDVKQWPDWAQIQEWPI